MDDEGEGFADGALGLLLGRIVGVGGAGGEAAAVAPTPMPKFSKVRPAPRSEPG